MKKVSLVCAAFAGLMFSAQARAENDVLSINWYHGAEKFQPIADAFTERTGIPVKVTSDYDKFNTDILMIGDYKSLLEGVHFHHFDRFNDDFFSEMSEYVPAKWRDADHHWIGFAVRVRTAIVNKANVPESDYPVSILDLADKKWRGRMTVRAASNIYNRSALAYIIARYGKKEAENWARGIVENVGDGEYLNDVQEAFAVAEGEYDIGYMNTYYLGYMPGPGWYGDDEEDMKRVENVKQKLEIVWLNGDHGNFGNVTGVGIAAPVKKGSEKHRQAQEMIRFLLSREGQTLMSKHVHKYPVRSDVMPDKLLTEMGGDLVLDEFNVNDLRYHYDEADRIMKEVGWKGAW